MNIPIKIIVQTTCEELGEQLVIKSRLVQGERRVTILVPICAQDDNKTRDEKIARAVHDASKLVPLHRA